MLVRFGDDLIINLDKLVGIENDHELAIAFMYNKDTVLFLNKTEENREECENALNLLRKIIPDLLTPIGRTAYLRNLGEMSKLFLSRHEQPKEK